MKIIKNIKKTHKIHTNINGRNNYNIRISYNVFSIRAISTIKFRLVIVFNKKKQFIYSP